MKAEDHRFHPVIHIISIVELMMRAWSLMLTCSRRGRPLPPTLRLQHFLAWHRRYPGIHMQGREIRPRDRGTNDTMSNTHHEEV